MEADISAFHFFYNKLLFFYKRNFGLMYEDRWGDYFYNSFRKPFVALSR